MRQKILVWDIPTRLFHCLLVLAIGFQYITAELLDGSIQLHFYGGYVTLCLIVFRLFWGVWGSYHAKFVNFVVGPNATFEYAISLPTKNSSVYLGHNPMGALSVIAVLAIIATQAISGLFVSDEIFMQGPYYASVSSSNQDIANWIHHNLFIAIWVFLAFHLSAIVFYKLYKKQDLVKAMVTGYKDNAADSKNNQKTASQQHESTVLIGHYWLRFLITVLMSAALVYCIVVVWAPEVVNDFYY